MHKLTIITVSAVALLAAGLEFRVRQPDSPLVLAAQEFVEQRDTVRARILVKVAIFRMEAFRDTSRVGFCNVLRVAGDSLALHDALVSLSEGTSLFVNPTTGCEEDRLQDNYGRRLLYFDSVTVSGRSARVFAGVRDPGGPTYHETYHVHQRDDGVWVVNRAEVRKGIVLHPPRNSR